MKRAARPLASAAKALLLVAGAPLLRAQAEPPKANPGQPLILPGKVMGFNDTDAWTWGGHPVQVFIAGPQVAGHTHQGAEVYIYAEGDDPSRTSFRDTKPLRIFKAKDLTAAAMEAEDAIRSRAAALRLDWPVAFDSIQVVGPMMRSLEYQFIPWPTMLLVARWPGTRDAFAVFAMYGPEMKIKWTGAFRVEAGLTGRRMNISPSGKYLLRPGHAGHRRAWKVEDLADGTFHLIPIQAFKGDRSVWQKRPPDAVPLWMPGDYLLLETWQVPHGFEPKPPPPSSIPLESFYGPGALATFDPLRD